PDLRLSGESRQVDLLVRPEHVQLGSNQHGTPVQVVQTSFRGTRKLYTLRLPSGTTFCALFPAEVVLRSEEAVHVTSQPPAPMVFTSRDDPESRADPPPRRKS